MSDEENKPNIVPELQEVESSEEEEVDVPTESEPEDEPEVEPEEEPEVEREEEPEVEAEVSNTSINELEDRVKKLENPILDSPISDVELVYLNRIKELEERLNKLIGLISLTGLIKNF